MNEQKIKSARNLMFIALCIDMAVTIFVVVICLWVADVLNDISIGVTGAGQSTMTMMKIFEYSFYASALTSTVVGLAIIYWLKAAYRYLKEDLLATGFIEEGYKIWGWIVPIMCLYKPYLVLDEIYKASAVDYPKGDKWLASPSSSILLAWWILWVIYHMVLLIVYQNPFLPRDVLSLNQVIHLANTHVNLHATDLIVSFSWFLVIGLLTQRLLYRSAQLSQNNAKTTPYKNINLNSPIAGVDEESVYTKIANELESGNTDKGLWTRLFAESGGDEILTKVLYINRRAECLMHEQTESTQQSDISHCERNNLADPALVSAVWNGNWSIANRLLRDGVKPSGTDQDGDSLLDLARTRGDKLMIQLLESYGAS